MGVTIHFEGCLRSPAQLEELVAAAVGYADEKCWPHKQIDDDTTDLLRILDDKEFYYSGPVFGIKLQPHPEAEPLKFEFDDEMFLQEYCKTQFAGAQTHIAVVDLLDLLKPFFVELRVEDEAEYWETRDEIRLRQHLNTVDRMLAEIKERDRSAKGPIYVESGRIIDIWASDNQTERDAASLARTLLSRIRDKFSKS